MVLEKAFWLREKLFEKIDIISDVYDGIVVSFSVKT
jgi:hypothetical protein